MYVCSIIDSKIPLFPFYKDLEVAAHIPDSQSAGQIKKTRYRYQSPPNRNLQTTTTTTTSSNLIQPKRHRPNPTQSKKKKQHMFKPPKMPSQTLPPPLTLIVATTPVRTPTQTHPRLGIGLNGSMPWPRIKADMSFFARVTTRPPPAAKPGTTNAMIMGRKTYDSVPEKLRPLGKRVSVVVSRDEGGSVRERVRRELEGKRKKERDAAVAKGETQDVTGTDAFVSSGFEDAVKELEEGSYGKEGKLGGIFVIGGGEIYSSALKGAADRRVRIVMTNIIKKAGGEAGEGYECDTFFPVDDFRAENGWRTASAEEVSEWVGEKVTGEWRDEGEVSIQMVGYERV